jgi:hypothetical protein
VPPTTEESKHTTGRVATANSNRGIAGPITEPPKTAESTPPATFPFPPTATARIIRPLRSRKQQRLATGNAVDAASSNCVSIAPLGEPPTSSTEPLAVLARPPKQLRLYWSPDFLTPPSTTASSHLLYPLSTGSNGANATAFSNIILPTKQDSQVTVKNIVNARHNAAAATVGIVWSQD